MPGCKLICLRCLLPQCFTGNDSDEDENEAARDEGYHSQNRRSSEIAPTTDGVTGRAKPHEMEMTEIQCESAVFIPKPRYAVNEYRKEPFKKTLDSPTIETTKDDSITCDITDIEVENVPLTEIEYSPNNALCSTVMSKTGEKSRLKTIMDSGSEVPKIAILNELDKKNDSFKDSAGENDCVMFDEPVLSSEYIECCEDTDYSKYKNYINEDALKICNDKTNGSRETFDKEIKQECGKITETRNDIDVGATDQQIEVKTESIKHSIKKNSCGKENVDTTNSGGSNEYVNLNPSENNETNGQCSKENIIKELVVSLDMESSVGDSKTIIKIQSENKNIDKDDRVQRSKDCVSIEFQNFDTTEKVLSKNVLGTRTTNQNDKGEFSEYIHNSEGVTNVMSLENSKTPTINQDQVIRVDDHDKLFVKTTESESISDSLSESLSLHETTKEDDEDTQRTDKS